MNNPSTCCFIEPSSNSQCIALDQKSAYLTCEQLLPTSGVKWCAWILGFCALFANMFVFTWGCQKVKSQSANEKQMKQILFITNLAVADFLMGLYLIIIALHLLINTIMNIFLHMPSHGETVHFVKLQDFHQFCQVKHLYFSLLL